ncbi:MAG: hypothetical protein WKG00_34605 [Polyangiaceae bacterium]
MAELRISYLLPAASPTRAVFVTDYGLRGGELLVDGAVVLAAPSHAALQQGVVGALRSSGQAVCARSEGDFDVRIWVDGIEAVREDAPAAFRGRAARLHAALALAASASGFVASWLYVVRARASGDAWAMKMALHMAGWHLLLTLALFPAALWGGRFGLAGVRVTALVFFAIHAAIALANLGPEAEGSAIAALNATSGLAFLATALARPPAGARRGSSGP